MEQLLGSQTDEEITGRIDPEHGDNSQLPGDSQRSSHSNSGKSNGEMEATFKGAIEEGETDTEEEQWSMSDKDEDSDVRGHQRGRRRRKDKHEPMVCPEEEETSKEGGDDIPSNKRRRRDGAGRFIRELREKEKEGNKTRLGESMVKLITEWVRQPWVKVSNSNQFKKLANNFPEKFMDGATPDITMIAMMAIKKFDTILDLCIDAKYEELANETWMAALAKIRLPGEEEKLRQHYWPAETYWCPGDSRWAILHMMHINNWDVETFIKEIIQVVDKKQQKLNTLVFQGVPNTGKTKLAESIIEAFEFRSTASNFTRKNAFPLGDCYQSRMIIANELRIDEENGELALLFLEGSEMEVNVKNKKQMRMKRTPVIITTNINIWGYCPSKRIAMEKRIHQYKFKECKDYKFTLRKKIHPLGWLFIQEDLDAMKEEADGNEDIYQMKIDMYMKDAVEQAKMMDLTCYEELEEEDILNDHN